MNGKASTILSAIAALVLINALVASVAEAGPCRDVIEISYGDAKGNNCRDCCKDHGYSSHLKISKCYCLYKTKDKKPEFYWSNDQDDRVLYDIY